MSLNRQHFTPDRQDPLYFDGVRDTCKNPAIRGGGFQLDSSTGITMARTWWQEQIPATA